MISDMGMAAGILGGLGLLFGLVLGVASKLFHVDRDERIDKIIEVLPGANCGGCGLAGCSAFAQAVVEGRAQTGGCTVGGESCAANVADIMGVEPSFVKKTARVKCAGTFDASPLRYQLKGLTNCTAAARLGGGPKACAYGCMGLGSCVAACEYDAIHIINGVAKVEEEACTACGRCVETCPKKLIEILPVAPKYFVICSSKDRGADMKGVCSVGCIGCKICEKACQFDAIHVENNLAKIDSDKCTDCGACAEKCPKKIIRMGH